MSISGLFIQHSFLKLTNKMSFASHTSTFDELLYGKYGVAV